MSINGISESPRTGWCEKISSAMKPGSLLKMGMIATVVFSGSSQSGGPTRGHTGLVPYSGSSAVSAYQPLMCPSDAYPRALVPVPQGGALQPFNPLGPEQFQNTDFEQNPSFFSKIKEGVAHLCERGQAAASASAHFVANHMGTLAVSAIGLVWGSVGYLLGKDQSKEEIRKLKMDQNRLKNQSIELEKQINGYKKEIKRLREELKRLNEDNDNSLNLRRHSTLQCLDNDVVLSQERFTCAIDYCPMRDPVSGPGIPNYQYNRATIVRYITDPQNRHGNGPISGRPVKPNELVSNGALKAEIEARLDVLVAAMEKALRFQMESAEPIQFNYEEEKAAHN